MKGISFRPALLPTAAALLLIMLFTVLGFWQLDRAGQKEALAGQFEAGGAAELDLNVIPDETLPRFQRVRVSGRYVPEHQFLLDNMPFAGTPGVHVLSVFEIRGLGQRLLVNRGWRPLGADRSRPQAPAPPAGELQLRGRLDRLPRPGLELEGEAASTGQPWPRLVVFPTIEELGAQLPYPLYPQVLLLEPSSEGGFERDWRPVHSGPEKHLAYAVQWFALAGAVLVTYVVVNIRRSDS